MSVHPHTCIPSYLYISSLTHLHIPAYPHISTTHLLTSTPAYPHTHTPAYIHNYTHIHLHTCSPSYLHIHTLTTSESGVPTLLPLSYQYALSATLQIPPWRPLLSPVSPLLYPLKANEGRSWPVGSHMTTLGKSHCSLLEKMHFVLQLSQGLGRASILGSVSGFTVTSVLHLCLMCSAHIWASHTTLQAEARSTTPANGPSLFQGQFASKGICSLSTPKSLPPGSSQLPLNIRLVSQEAYRSHRLSPHSCPPCWSEAVDLTDREERVQRKQHDREESCTNAGRGKRLRGHVCLCPAGSFLSSWLTSASPMPSCS